MEFSNTSCFENFVSHRETREMKKGLYKRPLIKQ